MLNAVVCQHERPVGAAACEPLITQAQVPVLNAVVCQHERPVGCAACEPLTTHEHMTVLNTAAW